MKKIKIRGLVNAAGWIFFAWGGIITVKGLYDMFWGEPEANFYSRVKWEFITQQQWLNWAGFELAYGLACAGIASLLWKYAKRTPEYITRQ